MGGDTGVKSEVIQCEDGVARIVSRRLCVWLCGWLIVLSLDDLIVTSPPPLLKCFLLAL